jgi:predicted nucleic acid-binding protein
VPDVHIHWRQLVLAHAVSGVQVHDARLVAVMKVHGIANLVTLNIADFRRYPGISAIHPQQLVASSQQGP